jgi:hypothetical protein
LWQVSKAENLFSKNLYFGIQNDSEVTKLQEFLTSEGIYSGPITGNFFSLTLKAVKDYQTREGISPAAGYFGPITRTKANAALSTQIEASNAQAVSETGSTPTPVSTPQTTTNVASTIQSQLDALLRQVALLQQQLQTQQQTQQSTQTSQSQTTQQTQIIQQNTQTVQQNITTPSQTSSFKSLTLTLASDSLNGSVTPGANNVALAKYYIYNTGEQAELYKISFGIAQVGTALSGTIHVKFNGAIICSTDVSRFPMMGTALAVCPVSIPTLNPNLNNNITVEVSIPSTATPSDSYTVKNMDITQIKWVKSNEIVDPGVNGIDGNQIKINTNTSDNSQSTAVQPGSLSLQPLQFVSGQGAPPSTDQVIAAGSTGPIFLAFKMISSGESQKIISLKITALINNAGNLTATTLQNIRLYEGEGSNSHIFATAPKFDSCIDTQCTVTLTASDNLLSAPVPATGVTIYIKADVASAGSAIFGSNFKFMIASPNDVKAKGILSGSTLINITGAPAANGISYIVPQNVKIEAILPTSPMSVGTNSDQTIAVFKLSNNGSSPIYIDQLKFANGGSASTVVGFKIYASAQSGAMSNISGWNNSQGYSATVGTNGTSPTVNFETNSLTDTERLIDGGSWRYLTIKTAGAAANNNTFQFSVGAYGDIRFSTKEVDLGYSGNGDSDINDTIYDLYVDGIPSLSKVTANN